MSAVSATPSMVPSSTIPSQAPSFAPAPYPVTVFAASQTLVGISASTFNANPNNTLALQSSIAACMSGVTSSNVLNLVVTDSTSTNAAHHMMLRLSSVAVSDVTSTASYSIYVANADSATSYSTLSNQLQTAVSQGTFNTLLQAYATQYGATSLSFVTSNSVATENLVPSDSGSDDGLSDGAIAGIVIGSVVGASLLFAVVYYLHTRSSGSSNGGNNDSIKEANSIYSDHTNVENTNNPVFQSKTLSGEARRYGGPGSNNNDL